MPLTIAGTPICGAPLKTDASRICHLPVQYDGKRCKHHEGITLEDEIEQPDPIDEELNTEVAQYLKETDEFTSQTIDDEINFINLQLRHLKRNYHNHIKDGDIGLAGTAIDDIANLAKVKAQLLKINDEIKITSGNYIDLKTMQEAIAEFIQILETRLVSYPDLLHEIKLDLLGVAQGDLQKDETAFDDFLSGLDE